MTIALNPNPPGGPALVSHPPQTKASTCNATIAAIAKKSLSLLSIEPTRDKIKCFTVLSAVSVLTFAYSGLYCSKETWGPATTIAAGLASCIFLLIMEHLEKKVEERAPPQPWRPHYW